MKIAEQLCLLASGSELEVLRVQTVLNELLIDHLALRRVRVAWGLGRRRAHAHLNVASHWHISINSVFTTHLQRYLKN